MRVSGPARRRRDRRAGAAAAQDARRRAAPHPRSRDAARRSTTALVLWFAAPRSETGEDVAEFHLHGGPADRQGRARRARRVSPDAGWPSRASSPAAPSTTASSISPQVEGLADLIDAETEAQRRQALRQMRRRAVGALRGLARAS